MKPVTINAGRLIVYRMFDVADEIDLTRIPVASNRLAIARPRTQVIVRDAPVSIALSPTTLRLGTRVVAAETWARVWSYGAVSLQFQIPLSPRTTWDELIELAALAEDDSDIDGVAATRLASLETSLAAALKTPHRSTTTEDYVIYVLESIDGATAAELSERVDIPALLLGESKIRLAGRTRQTILANTFSYAEDDLAVIDWNSALLVDEAGASDLADVLEFALTHLMEFRNFDEILDRKLEQLYERVERRRPALRGGGIERTARDANALYLEFADYAERVENSVKFVGDPYLATIFGAAAGRFQLRKWEESVGRKLGALARISELLQSEVNVRRGHFLEIIIILLILYEIFAAAVTLR